jgi:hypothetical protein
LAPKSPRYLEKITNLNVHSDDESWGIVKDSLFVGLIVKEKKKQQREVLLWPEGRYRTLHVGQQANERLVHSHPRQTRA